MNKENHAGLKSGGKMSYYSKSDLLKELDRVLPENSVCELGISVSRPDTDFSRHAARQPSELTRQWIVPTFSEKGEITIAYTYKLTGEK